MFIILWLSQKKVEHKLLLHTITTDWSGITNYKRSQTIVSIFVETYI